MRGGKRGHLRIRFFPRGKVRGAPQDPHHDQSNSDKARVATWLPSAEVAVAWTNASRGLLLDRSGWRYRRSDGSGQARMSSASIRASTISWGGAS